MKFWAIGLIVALCYLSSPSFAQTLILENPLDVDRTQEVVEIPLHDLLDQTQATAVQVKNLVAKVQQTGERLPVQLCDSSGTGAPDTFLVLIHLKAHEKKAIQFSIDLQAKPVPSLVFGREAAERKDDFAWENQQVAYRVYGPALEATGEITSGIDVWSKRVPNFVIDSFYKRDHEGTLTHNPALSYHKDNGQGLDSYYVGPTRGCGGTAVLADGKLVVSRNYTTKRVIADGPIRFDFELSYAPWQAAGTTVTETKRIVLDAGSYLNRITSTYTFAGGATLDIVGGIAVHDGAEVSFPVENKIASVWDTPQDPSAGRIATGMIASPGEHALTRQALGHELLVFQRQSGQSFTYYAGSGWSKADMPTAADWVSYLKLQLNMHEHPVRISWEKQNRLTDSEHPASPTPANDEATAVVGDSPENPGPLATDLSGDLHPASVKAAMRKVADWQLARVNQMHSEDWTFATLYLGMLAASGTLQDSRYHDYVSRVADHSQWTLGPRKTHADDQAIGQSFLWLYSEHPKPEEITPLRQQFDEIAKLPDDPSQPVWWWCDALFMAPPVWAQLASITRDPIYLNTMDREWRITANLLWDSDENLFFRDKSYFDKREKNGRKVFWSRGNGWVMGGLVRVLTFLPRDDPRRPFYEDKLRRMAEKIRSLQGADGLWRPGLLDKDDYPYPEISGSAFYVYATAWGIRYGLLSKSAYRSVVERGWRGLVAHIYADGRLGSIQPIGAAPGAYQPSSSYVFGSGAFLLAGSEVALLGRSQE